MGSHKAFFSRTGFTSFSGVRYNLRLPQKKKVSQRFQLFLPKHDQEKRSNQNKVYFLLMLPSISHQLRGCSTYSHSQQDPLEGRSSLLKCCLSPRQREEECGRACSPLNSLEKSTSAYILWPKHIPQSH